MDINQLTTIIPFIIIVPIIMVLICWSSIKTTKKMYPTRSRKKLIFGISLICLWFIILMASIILKILNYNTEAIIGFCIVVAGFLALIFWSLIWKKTTLRKINMSAMEINAKIVGAVFSSGTTVESNVGYTKTNSKYCILFESEEDVPKRYVTLKNYTLGQIAYLLSFKRSIKIKTYKDNCDIAEMVKIPSKDNFTKNDMENINSIEISGHSGEFKEKALSFFQYLNKY